MRLWTHVKPQGGGMWSAGYRRVLWVEELQHNGGLIAYVSGLVPEPVGPFKYDASVKLWSRVTADLDQHISFSV